MPKWPQARTALWPGRRRRAGRPVPPCRPVRGHAGSLVVPVGDTAVTVTVPVPRRVPMAAEKPIRILIADDQHLVRQGFRAMFDRVPLVEVVAEASTLKGTVDQYARHRPDVLI